MVFFGIFWLFLGLLINSEALSAPIIFDHPNPQAGANFGSAIASVGDVNGDGVPDLLIGAPLQNVGANADQGQAYLISGATGALLLTLDNPFPQAGAKFGASVASAGDVDGDGKNDLLIGAPNQNVGLCNSADTGGCSVGQAFVFSSATGTLLRVLNHPIPHSGAFFGSAVASGGGKLIIGTPGQSVGVFVPSYVFVFSSANGSLLFTINDPNLREIESDVGLTFGSVVASAGDVNGDGVPDILVGDALQNVGANVDQGQVHIFSGVDGTLIRTLNNPFPQAGAHFGVSAASVGDINGDGKPEIIVGASLQDVGANFEQGQAYVFSGATGALLFTLNDPTPQMNANFGAAVAAAGDVNGDLIPDLLVGAPGQIVNGIQTGRAFVFSGANGSLLLTLDDPTAQANASFGAVVVSGGDLNGDGRPDPVVGAPFQNVGANPLQGQVSAPTPTGANRPPIANAGPDQTVNEGALVNLNGTASSDPDGNPITFLWTQTAGPTVTLSNPASPTPTFAAPQVNANTVLTFQLVVNDGKVNSSPDTVNITVVNVNGPDLTGTITKLTRSTSGSLDTLNFTLAICNLGTQQSIGGFTVKFFVSADATLGGGDALIFTKILKDKDGEGRIKPGNCVNVSATVKVTGPTQSKFLIAHIDSENNIAESNETNNIVFRQIP